jgi:hypothetical protein
MFKQSAMKVVGEFEKTPKALANFSARSERQRQTLGL